MGALDCSSRSQSRSAQLKRRLGMAVIRSAQSKRRGAMTLSLLLAAMPALAKESTVKQVSSIKTAKSGIDVAITREKEFLQSNLPVLNIGDQVESTISRYPDDGDMHTLIFTVPVELFKKAKNGDRLTFRYGRGSSQVEDFGALDKSQLDK